MRYVAARVSGTLQRLHDLVELSPFAGKLARTLRGEAKLSSTDISPALPPSAALSLC
jgi:hypothetical protein